MINNKQEQLKKINIFSNIKAQSLPKKLIFTFLLLLLIGMGVWFVVAQVTIDQKLPVGNTSTYDSSANISINFTSNYLNNSIYILDGTNYILKDPSLLFFANYNNLTDLKESDVLVRNLVDGGINGTVVGGSNISFVNNGYGRTGGSFNFSGNKAYIQITDLNLNGSTQMTYASWFKDVQPDGTYGNYNYAIIGGRSTNAITISDNGTSIVRRCSLYIYVNTTQLAVYGGDNCYNKNEWTYLVGVYNGSHALLYVNGILKGVSSTSIVGVINYTNWVGYSTRIGASQGGNDNSLNGSVDDTIVLNRSLSSNEVSQFYNIRMTRYTEEAWVFNISQLFSTQILNHNYNLCVSNLTNQVCSAQQSIFHNFTSYFTEVSTPIGTTTNSSVLIKYNATLEPIELKNITWLWNGFNYSLWDNNVQVLFNFNNLPALGESSAFVRGLNMNSNNGTVGFGASWNSTGGYYNDGAYEFNGTNTTSAGGINLGDIPTYNYSTISYWLNVHSNSSTQLGSPNALYVLNKWSSGGNFELREYLRPSTRLFICSWFNASTSTEFSVSSIQSLNYNQWYYITCWINMTHTKIYINGVLDNTNVALTGGVKDTTESLRIGNSGRTAEGYDPLNASLDDFEILNRSLSDAEVFQKYKTHLVRNNFTDWSLTFNELINNTILNSTNPLTNYNYYLCSKNSTGNEFCSTNRTVTKVIPVNIIFPKNITYTVNLTNITYTINDATLNYCWFSENDGASNSSIVSAGTNFTMILNAETFNTWKVWCNDSVNHLNSSSVSFSLDVLPDSGGAVDTGDSSGSVANYTILANSSIYYLNLNYNINWKFNKEQTIDISALVNNTLVKLDSLDVKLRNNITSVSYITNPAIGRYIYTYRISEQNVSTLIFDIIAIKDGVTTIKTATVSISNGAIDTSKLRNFFLNSFTYIKDHALESFIVFVIFVVFIILGAIVAGGKSKRKTYYA